MLSLKASYFACDALLVLSDTCTVYALQVPYMSYLNVKMLRRLACYSIGAAAH